MSFLANPVGLIFMVITINCILGLQDSLSFFFIHTLLVSFTTSNINCSESFHPLQILVFVTTDSILVCMTTFRIKCILSGTEHQI